MVDPQPGSVVLYHVPPSFYSQVARLVLAEKAVAYRGTYAVGGPPRYETYEPWYLALNPGGTLPTLVIGDEAIADSRDILHEVDRRFAGPALTPADEHQQAAMQQWLDRAYALPERVLAYGSKRLRSLGARVNRGRLAALVRQKTQHPELQPVLDAKIADIESFMADAADDATVTALHKKRDEALDALNTQLGRTPFVVGDAYTLADLMWTVSIARQRLLGGKPLVGRPALAAWYRRMRARPSFRNADVWERKKPWKMVPMVWTKFRRAFWIGVAGLSLLLGGTVAGVLWAAGVL